MEIIPFEKSVASHPKGAKYWSQKNIDSNGNFIKPESVKLSSREKYLFDCDVCNHAFLKRVEGLNRTKDPTWCNYCSHNVLCKNEECQMCFQNSFASLTNISILECWSKNNVDEEGNHITPRDIFKFTKKYYLFDCKDCGHQIYQKPSIIGTGSWCIYCAHLKLCDDEKCEYCYKNSFDSYEDKNKLKCWCDDNIDNNNNKIFPRNVFKTTSNKYKFKCHQCNHIFLQSPAHITLSNGWCKYCCTHTQALCDDENCTHCFNNSFASNPLSVYWSIKNDILPRNVMKSTPTSKYIFDCNICNNEFKMSTNAISKGAWCPYCKNKTEKILFNKLKEVFPMIECQFYADWCKNPETDKHLPFDFLIKEHKLIIELDGEQHFVEVKRWNLTPEKQFIRDIYKMNCATDNGYIVIRITQQEVYNNSYDWFEKLTYAIRHAIENKSLVYFISKRKDIYKKHFEYFYQKYYS